MKKIIASTGMVALGVVGLHAAAQDSKPWSLHGAFRGFYDSNSTLQEDGAEIESFGLGAEVGGGYSVQLDQGMVGVDYTYGLKWYEGRETGETDQSHKFNLKANYALSEQYKVSLKDSFVVSLEPTVLDEGGAVTGRTLSDAMRNRVNLDFSAQFTPTLGATIGYGNTWYDYDQDASDVASPLFSPSRSQLLDRMEHLVPIEGRYTLNPETILLVGYQFGMTGYRDNDGYLISNGTSAAIVDPGWRDSRSHYFYGGVEHNFTSQLNGSLRAGVETRDYTDVPVSWIDDSSSNPYVDASLSYLYNPGSYVLVGYRHLYTAVDLTVLDAQTDMIYLSLTHKITARLTANLNYQFQHASFDQGFTGGFDDQKENFNIFGVNLSYSINQFLSAEVGYNLDDLDSDVTYRSYTRNVGYIGLRANF